MSMGNVAMSRRAAEERYRQRRHRAFAEAELRLLDARVAQPDELVLSDIPLLGLIVTTSTWASDPRRRVGWDWRQLHLQYQRNYPDRFELAVVSGNQLCAFALGRPSESRGHCCLDYIEGSPDPAHPLKGRVLPVVFTALERLSAAIGATEMRIMEPLPELIP